MEDKEQFVIEVEVFGKQLWVFTTMGEYFRSEVYDFAAAREQARVFETLKDAQSVSKRISPVYDPQVRKV